MVTVNFLNIFGKSPIKPMQKHMGLISKAVDSLSNFISDVLKGNWDEAEKHFDEIINFESEADVLKKSIRKHLSSSLFMPVSRGDLLGLITAQDKIASMAKHLASIMFTRKIIIPNILRKDFEVLVDKCVLTTYQAKKAIDKLDELVETGFKGKEVDYIEELIEHLEDLERETDLLQVGLRDKLHSIEPDINPVEAIFLYKIIDWCGDLADRAHNVGYKLEILLSS